MKLFKSEKPSRRIFRYVNEFQQSMQSGDYWTAKKAVEQALRIDPENEKLHDMKDMTLELLRMQEAQRGTARGHAKAPTAPTKIDSISHTPQRDFDDVKEAVNSYRAAVLRGDADASASLWDEAASALVYVTAEDGEVHKGFYEVRNALRTESARNEYGTHELVDQGIAFYGTLACAFFEIRFERSDKDVNTTPPGTLTTTLVLRKTGDAWKIVHGHASTATSVPS